MTDAEPAKANERTGAETGVLRFAADLLTLGALAGLYLVAALYLVGLMPDELATRTDIVGYPTVFAFNIDRYVTNYYIYTFGLLAFVTVGFLLIHRVLGTARPRQASGSWPPPIAHGPWVARLDLYVLPVVLVAFLALVVQAQASGQTWQGAPLLVGLATALLIRVAARSTSDDATASAAPGGLAEAILLLASLALVALCLAMLVRAHVTVTGRGAIAVLATPTGAILLAIALAGLAAALLWVKSRQDAQARRIARLRVYEGAAILALGLIVHFRVVAGAHGFDFFHEGESLVPARLMTEGAFPWRDFQIIHGIFFDGLKTRIGQLMFGDTAWAGQMINAILFPLYVSACYWFFRVASGGNVLFAMLGALMMATQYSDLRFILLPVCLLLLHVAIARGTILWCALFGVVTTVQILITPEAAFFGAAAGAAIVLHDLLAGRDSGNWRGSFGRTITSAVAMAITAGAAAILLASYHALGAYLEILTTIAGGHHYVGGLPRQHVPYIRFLSGFPLICGVIVLFGALALIRGRARIPPWYFVTIALAIYAILYYPKYLGRADPGHLYQVIAMVTPLLAMSALAAVLAAESLVAAAFGALDRWLPWRGVPLVAVAAVALFLSAPPLFECSGATVARDAAASVFARTSAAAEPVVLPNLGFVQPSGNQRAPIEALAAFLDRHLAPGDALFDMTNSAALFHFVLERRPASRYFHVSLAVRERTQRDVIRELIAARPKLVVFDSTGLGMPAWDGIHNSVRHYLISHYLLGHYRPVAVVAGYLMMARNDLAAEWQEPTAPDIGDFTGQCRWGNYPYYAQIEATSARARLAEVVIGMPQPRRYRVVLSGWAGAADRAEPREIYVTIDGKVVAQGTTGLARADVAQALNIAALARSGFRVAFERAEPVAAATVRVFAQRDAASVGELTFAGPARAPGTGTITLDDGRSLQIVPDAKLGFTDSMRVDREERVSLRLPNTDDRIFALQFDVAGRDPAAEFELLGPQDRSLASFQGARAGRATLTVPTGACLGWDSIARGSELRLRILTQADAAPVRVEAVRAIYLPAEEAGATP